MVDSWLRALERAGEVIGSQDPDAAAQARLREQYPADTMFGDSGTGRDYREQPRTAAEQAAARKAFASVLFGPERESILPGEQQASRGERFLRDWGASEQEFRLAGQRFSEGQIGAGFGWGALAMAGAIPFFGDIAQGVARAGRIGRGASATARAAVPPPNPALKAIDDIWHEERLEWLPDFGRPYDEITGETLEGPGIYIDQLDELENAIPGITQFSDEWAYSASVNADARQALADALEAGGEIPDTYAGSNLALGLDILSQSPPVRSPVYRASTFTPDEVNFLREGTEIDLPLSSFTYNQSDMRNFVGMGSEGRSTQVVFTLREGAPAIPIGAIAREVAPIYGEVVTAGRFRIASVREATMPQGTMGGIGGSIGGRPYLDVELEYVAPFELGEQGRNFTVSLPGSADVGPAANRIQEGASTVPGSWVRKDAAEVPTEWVREFAEYDRAAQPFGVTDMDALKQSIIEEGFKDPLIIEVGLNGRASLIEGNHRLAIALELGLENVPVRVITSRNLPAARTRGSGRNPVVTVQDDIGDGWYLTPQEAIKGVPKPLSETPNLDRLAQPAGNVAGDIFSSVEAFESTGRTLLHGTPRTFERFESASATYRGRGKVPSRSQGYFYFTDDPMVAATFRQNVSDVSVDTWLRRNPDFDLEDLEDPEIFELFREDVANSLRGRRLEIARDDYLEDWQEITPADITYEDIAYENPIRAVSSRGQEIETVVYGREIDLRNVRDLPPDLLDAMKKDRLIDDAPGMRRLATWQVHERSFANTAEWMRENGYGKAIVNDAPESGGQAVIALEEYIGFGRDPEEVFEAAKSAAGGQ